MATKKTLTKKSAKKPAKKKATAAKKPAKKPAKKTAAKKTAKKTAIKKPAKKTAAKKTGTKKPAKKTATKKLAKKKAAAKKPAKKAAKKKTATKTAQKVATKATKKKASNGVRVTGTRHDPPVYLLVHLPIGMSPEERAMRFEDPLEMALGPHGTITGGGTSLGDDEQPVSCDIEIEVYDVAHALPLVRRILVDEKAPDGSLVTRLSKKGEFEILFMIGD